MIILDKKIGALRIRIRLTWLFYAVAGILLALAVWAGFIYLSVSIARMAWNA